MRCFVAVDLPEGVRDALERAQASLRSRAPRADVRWVDPAGLHVTLKFLGEVREGELSIRSASRPRAVPSAAT